MARAWGHGISIREGQIGRVLIGFMALAFLGLVAAVAAVAWINARNDRHTQAVVHTYRVELAIGELRRLIEQGETTRRGYLLSPQTPGFRDAYREVMREVPRAVTALRDLVSDNPRQRLLIADLERRIEALNAQRDRSVGLIERQRSDEALQLFREEASGVRLRAIRARFDAMRDEEQRLLAIRDREVQDSLNAFYVALALTALLLLAVATTSVMVVTRYTRDLAASRDAMRGMNDHLEEMVAARTADLSRANDEIQRFAYIVSHDLRSPLVNVMGFTAELEAAAASLRALVDRAEASAPDLLDRDAALAAREDLPEAIGFIRTSTQRMDRLINAILVLSRQGRRVLAPEPLDTAAIVGGIRDTLAHRLDEQEARVDIVDPLPAIVSDRLAIEQILSNLIENAVKYRHPDRPVRVTVAGGREGDRAWIEVRDNGRGIDPRDHERVFDLFRRSGQQDQPGEGIGLAHVRALAYRLGGIVSLRSTLGEGATFRLSLPALFAEQESKA